MFYNSHTVFPPFCCAFDATGFYPLQVFGCAALFDSHAGWIFRRFQPLLSHRCYPILPVFNPLLTAISVFVGCYAICSAPPLPITAAAAADRLKLFFLALVHISPIITCLFTYVRGETDYLLRLRLRLFGVLRLWGVSSWLRPLSCYLELEEYLGFGVEFLVWVVAASACQLSDPRLVKNRVYGAFPHSSLGRSLFCDLAGALGCHGTPRLGAVTRGF